MIFSSLNKHACLVAEAAERLKFLEKAVAWEGDFSMAQRFAFYAVALELSPDLIIELGRGYGNSTAVFAEVARRLPQSEIHSYCLTDVWRTTVFPRIQPGVEPNWGRNLHIHEGDLTAVDFAPLIGPAETVLLFWDAHGFTVAEHILSHIMPLLSDKRHLVICHDISDNRNQQIPEPYHGNRFWRGMDDFYANPEKTAYFNIGWCRGIVDQVIPILDFCHRNSIELHSADEDFLSNKKASPLSLDCMTAMIGPAAQAFRRGFHVAYFSLNEGKPPFTFPGRG